MFLNKIEQKELKNQIYDNRNNIRIFLILAFILTVLTMFLIYQGNKLTIKEESVPVAYSSEGIVTDREPTTLEKIGLKEKMFISDVPGRIVCSNCCRRLDGDDDFFTIVMTEGDSFAKIILCDKCFYPFADLLSTIGF